MKRPPDMTLEEVKSELRSYRPGVASEIIASIEYLDRRSHLWRRLDTLIKLRKTYRRGGYYGK